MLQLYGIKNHLFVIFTAGIFLLPVLIPFAGEASASPPGVHGSTGLGGVLGEPTGVTGKHWIGNQTALAATAAWSFRVRTRLHAHLDYQIHNFETIRIPRDVMAFYYGVGGRILAGDDGRFGMRVPVGLAYYFDDHPIEIFLEVAPILDLIPDIMVDGNSGIGIRYYF